MMLNHNVKIIFADVEQVALSRANIVLGVDHSPDRMLQQAAPGHPLFPAERSGYTAY
jgi:catalase